MKIIKKHRKLFYVPGMISLVLLSLCCLYFFYVNKSFDQETTIDIGLPDQRTVADIEKEYPLTRQRNFTEFSFNGTLEAEQENLSNFRTVLKQQNKIKDTVNGIRLRFGKQMKYEVYIRVLDILTAENTPTYVPVSNQLLIVNGAPSDNRKEREKWEKRYGKFTGPICGNTGLEAAQRKMDRENREWTEKEVAQKSFFDRHRYLFLAYFIIILLNVFVLIKFNRNRIYNQKAYI